MVILAAGATAALGASALALWSGVCEPRLMRIRQLSVACPHWLSPVRAMRILVISDLHASWPHVMPWRIERIVDRGLALDPDLIVLPGDFVNATILPSVALHDIARALGGLTSGPARCLAVLGNHDHEANGRRVRAALEAAGIEVLYNDVVALQHEGQRLQVAGVDDLRRGRPDPARVFQALDPGDPAILVSHIPDIFPMVPTSCFLTISGHTHGGQVRLPFIGPMITMSRLPRAQAYGLHRDGERWLYVSGGVGTSGLPIRFNMPPEIALLSVVGADADGHDERQALRHELDVDGRAHADVAI